MQIHSFQQKSQKYYTIICVSPMKKHINRGKYVNKHVCNFDKYKVLFDGSPPMAETFTLSLKASGLFSIAT